MPAIVTSEAPESVAAISGEWQSDRNKANPQERSQAAANEDTHNSSDTRDPAKMRLVFTVFFHSPRACLDWGYSPCYANRIPYRNTTGGSFWQRRQNHEIILTGLGAFRSTMDWFRGLRFNPS